MTGRPRFPDLDGLRAIAALAVVLFHVTLWLPIPDHVWYKRFAHVISFGSMGGQLGVTFFFVLSGFLITYLMLHEQASTNGFSIRRFYARRVLRIWPLYFATLAVAYLLCPIICDNAPLPPVSMYALFLGNYDHIGKGDPSCGMLGVLWSVCVEEQFYLIWPLVFALFGTRRSFPCVMLVIGLGSIWFAHATASDARGYYHLFSNMRYLVGGSLLAYVSHGRSGDRLVRQAGIPAVVHAAVYAVAISAMFLAGSLEHGGLRSLLLNDLPMFFFFYVLYHQVHTRPSWLHLRNFPLLGRLGRISYGLYLLHMIPISLLASWGLPMWCSMPIAVVATIGLSALSFRFLESPFLRLKERWA